MCRYLCLAIILAAFSSIQGQTAAGGLPSQLHQHIQTLFASLEDGNASKRQWAGQQMALIGEQIIPLIKQYFPGANYRARREMVSVLARINNDDAKQFIFRCLTDNDYGVRNRACHALVELSNRDRQLLTRIKKLKHLAPKIQVTLDMLRDTIVYKQVETELHNLISPQGGFGFYEGQFKRMLYLGADAVAPLVAIFTQEDYVFVLVQLQKDEENIYKIRYLAGEAITEFHYHMGRNKAGVLRELHQMVDKSKDNQLKEIAMTTLYFLGDTRLLDTRIHYWKNKIRREPYNEESYSNLGMIYLRIRKETLGVQLLHKAVSINPYNSLTHYNLACAYSCLGKIDKALDSLETSVAKGYDDVAWMKRDGDLRNISHTARFKRLIKKLEDRIAGK